MTTSRRLIETLRVQNGHAPLLPLHRARLAASCHALDLPLPEIPPVPAVAASTWRWSVGETGLETSLRPLPAAVPLTAVIAAGAFQPYPHKTADRSQFDRAAEEAAGRGADAGILLSGGGAVAEGSIWSVFWWEGADVAAPPLHLGILPGVARARIAALAGPLLEREVDPAAWGRRSPFVANAVRGPVAVAELEGRVVAQSPATARLAALFWG